MRHCWLGQLIAVCSDFESENDNMATNLTVLVRRLTAQGADDFTCDYKTFGLPVRAGTLLCGWW